MKSFQMRLLNTVLTETSYYRRKDDSASYTRYEQEQELSSSSVFRVQEIAAIFEKSI
jgi:hypothetical protein